MINKLQVRSANVTLTHAHALASTASGRIDLKWLTAVPHIVATTVTHIVATTVPHIVASTVTHIVATTDL